MIRPCFQLFSVMARFGSLFFSREESRMHVHIAHTDGEAKFWLDPNIELAMNQGLPTKQIREVASLLSFLQN